MMLIKILLLSIILSGSALAMNENSTQIQEEAPFNLNWLAQNFNLNPEDVISAEFINKGLLYQIEFRGGKEEEMKIFGDKLLNKGCDPIMIKSKILLKKIKKMELLESNLDNLIKLKNFIFIINDRFKEILCSSLDLSEEENTALLFVKLLQRIYPYTRIISYRNDETRGMDNGALNHMYGLGNFQSEQIAHQIIEEFSNGLQYLFPKVEELFSNAKTKEKIAPFCGNGINMVETFIRQTKMFNCIYSGITSFSLGNSY